MEPLAGIIEGVSANCVTARWIALAYGLDHSDDGIFDGIPQGAAFIMSGKHQVMSCFNLMARYVERLRQIDNGA